MNGAARREARLKRNQETRKANEKRLATSKGKWPMIMNTFQKHLAAIQSGEITRSNVIGLRKAFNHIARLDAGLSGNRSSITFEQADKLNSELMRIEPKVTGELHESGLKVLRNSRYKKRLADVADIIADIDCFRLSHFDWIGRLHCVPVYRAIDSAGRSFTFRNIPWQTAFYSGGESGPVIFGVKR